MVVIPTVDGGTPVLKKEGARVHLSELEVKGFLQNMPCACLQQCKKMHGRFSLGVTRGPILTRSQASKDEQLLRKNLGVVHQDEQTVNQQGTGARLHPTSLRPKSLAVPGMTSSSFSSSLLLSFLQEPQVRIKSPELSCKFGFGIPKSTFLFFISY